MKFIGKKFRSFIYATYLQFLFLAGRRSHPYSKRILKVYENGWRARNQHNNAHFNAKFPVLVIVSAQPLSYEDSGRKIEHSLEWLSAVDVSLAPETLMPKSIQEHLEKVLEVHQAQFSIISEVLEESATYSPLPSATTVTDTVHETEESAPFFSEISEGHSGETITLYLDSGASCNAVPDDSPLIQEVRSISSSAVEVVGVGGKGQMCTKEGVLRHFGPAILVPSLPVHLISLAAQRSIGMTVSYRQADDCFELQNSEKSFLFTRRDNHLYGYDYKLPPSSSSSPKVSGGVHHSNLCQATGLFPISRNSILMLLRSKFSIVLVGLLFYTVIFFRSIFHHRF